MPTLSPQDGVFSNITDPLRPSTALKVGDNINQYPRGVFTNQICGWVRQREAEFNSGDSFLGFSTFIDLDGTEYLLMQVGDTLYHYDIDTQTETAIITGLSTALATGQKALPCMKMFVPYVATIPYMVYTNGIDAPRKITRPGGVWTVANLQLNAANFGAVALGGTLPAKLATTPQFCFPFLDRMLYAGFSGDAAFDVMLSDAGLAESCTSPGPLKATDGGLVQVDPQLGRITAVFAFKLTNDTNQQIAIIGQQKGVSIITGTSALDFKCFTMTSEYGIPSNNAFIQINSNLWFLADDGVRSFANLVQNNNLANAPLTYPVQDLSFRFNDVQMYQAHAVHHKRYQEVQFWFPVDSDTEPNNAFVMSYAGSPDPANPAPVPFTKSGTNCCASIYFNKKFYGGSVDGLLQEHHSGNMFDGVVATSQVTMAMMKPDDPEVECSLEQFQIVTTGGGQKFQAAFTYLARVHMGPYIGTKQFDAGAFDVVDEAGGGTTLGAWSLGSASTPSNHMRFHEIKPIGMGAKSWEASLVCNQADHKLDLMVCNYRLGEGGQVA